MDVGVLCRPDHPEAVSTYGEEEAEVPFPQSIPSSSSGSRDDCVGVEEVLVKVKAVTWYDFPLEKLASMNAAELKEMSKNIDLKANSEISRRKVAEIRREASKLYFCGPEGEVDTSSAVFLDSIDGASMKKMDNHRFALLMAFQFKCMQNFGLKYFPPPPPSDSGLTTKRPFSNVGLKTFLKEWEQSKHNNLLCELAIAAINQYNTTIQKPNLEFKHIVAAKNPVGKGLVFYLTFSATDLDTKKIDLYQAAVARLSGEPVLGLLREFSSGKVLAILSLRGVEEDLAALRKYQADRPRK